ncbi:hypothetical protein I541_5281 [Mycobacteroides abscessus]|nr:hypothetical protein I541_5281 [Mycobacteroides abscessus]
MHCPCGGLADDEAMSAHEFRDDDANAWGAQRATSWLRHQRQA